MKKKTLQSCWKYKLNLKEIRTQIRIHRRKHKKCAFLIIYDNSLFMHSHKLHGSIPAQHCQTYCIPRRIASDVPIMLIPSSILLQILTAWPDPTGPQWTTLAPIVERRSCAAGNTSGGPPTINVSWPNLAAFTPTVNSKLYTYNVRCCMERNRLSFSSGSHVTSTKILYEKPSLHISENACLLQDSNKCKMEWHLARMFTQLKRTELLDHHKWQRLLIFRKGLLWEYISKLMEWLPGNTDHFASNSQGPIHFLSVIPVPHLLILEHLGIHFPVLLLLLPLS